MISDFKWNFKWFKISTKYGEQIIYEPQKFAVAFANNTYQAQIRNLLESNKYDVFLDVGAAWGHFALIGSKCCKRVIAFEPQPFRYGFLLYNCRHLFNVDCRYEYVSCKGDVPKMGGIQEMVELKHQKPYNVPVITLDDLDIKQDEKVLVKLDVEGNELKVLQGATKLLKNPNVDWIIDVHHHQGIKDQQVINFLKHKNAKCHGALELCSVYEFIGDKK